MFRRLTLLQCCQIRFSVTQQCQQKRRNYVTQKKGRVVMLITQTAAYIYSTKFLQHSYNPIFWSNWQKYTWVLCAVIYVGKISVFISLFQPIEFKQNPSLLAEFITNISSTKFLQEELGVGDSLLLHSHYDFPPFFRAFTKGYLKTFSF